MRHFQIFCVLLVFLFLISTSFAAEEKIDLKASIDLALKQNPGIISLQKKLEASEQSARQVASSFLPSLTLEAGYGESYSQPYDVSLNVGGGTTTFSTLPNNPFWGSNYTFTLKQPIYMGGKMVNNLGIAKQGILAAKEELRRNEQDLIYKVIESYLNILKLKKLQNVQENKLIYAQESYKKIKKMKEVGIVVDSNVLAAEILQVSSEQELKKTKNNLSIAQDFFVNLLGKENSNFDLLEVNMTKNKFLLVYEKFLSQAYEKRPDWQLIQINKGINDLNIKLAGSDYFPTISLIGDYGWKGLSYINSDLKYNLSSWDILTGMSWTLFNSFGTVAKVKEAELNKKAGLADEESLKKAIALEVKEAFYNLETSQKDFEIAELSNQLSQLSLKTEEAKRKVGMKTDLDVLEKKVNSLESEIGLIVSNYNLILAQAKFNKAVGEEVFEMKK